MDKNLPQPPNLKEIQESNKKHGRKQTLLDQYQSILPTATLVILIILMGSGAAAYISLNNKINNIINLHNTNTNTNSNNVTLNSSDSQVTESHDQQSGLILGDNSNNTTGFDSNDWIINSFDIDDEGFFCPNKKGFDYWSIWSKKNYPALMNEIRIKFAIKQIKNTDKPPTLAITYGEYKPNRSPIQFYRLNIFDTDNKSLRLYNSKNDSKAQGYLELEPDLESEMTVILSPASSDRESRIININPSLIYVNPNDPKQIVFKADTKFEVSLPTVGLDDETVQKQIGIGSSNGTCFKIVGFETK